MSCEVLAEIEIEPGVVPVVGLTISHEPPFEVEETLKGTAAPLAAVICTDCSSVLCVARVTDAGFAISVDPPPTTLPATSSVICTGAPCVPEVTPTKA